MTNKQYTDEERKSYLEQWRQSGLSGNKFCRDNNIRPTTFYNWTKKERQKEAKQNPGFVKLQKLGINAPTNIVIEKNDWKIILPPGFSREDAVTVIDLVESINVS